ncbi:MAG: APC family permease [Candidatus Hodarchaeota archaeon]
MVEDKELKRGLSLPMAVFIIIGMVIASSIWILPATELRSTGPAIFLAYIFAVIPGIFVAYIIAYLGSAFPVAGGTYVINSRLTGGFGGFMTVWLIILAVGSALAFLAATFGVFIGEIFSIPDDAEVLFALIIGIVVLFAFYFLNWIKIEISGLIELLITVLGDILVIVIFIIAAIPKFNPSNFDPLFPEGFTPIIVATLTFFFSYTGFTLILDVAGEVKKPQKNIPRALLISIPILVALYSLQALMVAGIKPYTEEVGTVTEIILTEGLLPQGTLLFITILIAVAIASTLHPLFMAFSRDILMAGREEILPKRFSKVHKKFRTPIPALTLLLIVGVILLIVFIPLLGPLVGVENTAALLSAITGVTVLILQIPICLTGFFIPKKFPQYHEKAGFKPSLRALKIMGILGSLFSLLFVLILFLNPDAGPLISLVIFPYAIVGAIIYFFRKRSLKKKGINVKEMMTKLPESIITDEGAPSKIERLAHEND